MMSTTLTLRALFLVDNTNACIVLGQWNVCLLNSVDHTIGKVTREGWFLLLSSHVRKAGDNQKWAGSEFESEIWMWSSFKTLALVSGLDGAARR